MTLIDRIRPLLRRPRGRGRTSSTNDAARTNFSPSSRWAVLVLLGTLIVSWFTYLWLLGAADQRVFAALHAATVRHLEGAGGGQLGFAEQHLRLADLLRAQGLEASGTRLPGTAEELEANFTGKPASLFLRIAPDALNRGQTEARPDPTVISFVVNLVEALGNEASSNESFWEQTAARDQAVGIMTAGALAGIPFYIDRLEAEAAGRGCMQDEPRGCQGFVADHRPGTQAGTRMYWRRPLPRLAYFVSANRTSDSVIELLLRAYGVEIRPAAQPDIVEQKRYIRRAAGTFLSTLSTHPAVRTAGLRVAFARGLEQFTMLAIALWLACMLWKRGRERAIESDEVDELSQEVDGLRQTKPPATLADRQAVAGKLLTRAANPKYSRPRLLVARAADFAAKSLKQKQEGHEAVAGMKERLDELRDRELGSRWALTWAMRALPAIGFIGTVRGILFALRDAGDIFAAPTGAAQAAAISSIGAQLGVAFTTTLIALVAGLALGWWDDRQTQRELALIERIETNVSDLLDDRRLA